MKDINIKKISNGYIVQAFCGYPTFDETSVYLKDMREVIKHLNTVYGQVEDLVNKMKSEREDKEQIPRKG